MKENAIDRQIPVLFQKLNQYEAEDTRFIKVKIWLMHLEENLNGSYFEESVVQDAIDSLANTPILAYVEDNSEGETDFSDHRMVLVKEDGKFKVKYIGQAIGLIPETNNAQFEYRVCDDGVERKFLTCDGLVWQKWDDPVDIFNRDVVKSQSMELHTDYTGEFKDDGLFHFTSFKFFGACALGSDVLPAMRNATVEAQFSYEKMHEELQVKMEQFKTIFTSNKEGGNIVNEKLELLQKYSLTEDTLKEKGINLEEFSLEELEVKFKELTKVSDEPVSEPEKDFALVASQLKDEIRGELYKEFTEDEWGYKSRKYWYVDHTDTMVIAEDSNDNYRLVGLNYSINNDVVTIDFESKSRVKLAYELVTNDVEMAFEITSKDKVEYELNVKEKQVEQSFSTEKENLNNKITELDGNYSSLQNNYSTLQTELEELKQFKSTKLSEERTQAENELYEQFTSELTEEEIDSVKEKASEFTLEDLEKELYTLVGKKKAKFSMKQSKKESIKVSIDAEEEPKQYSKEWAHLIEKYSK